MGVGAYGVSWHEGGEGVLEGRLRLGAAALAFDGVDETGAAVSREIAYAELTGIRVVDEPGAGITLVLQRATGEVALRSTAARAGLLQELVAAVAESSLGLQRRAVVVLPLREGAAGRARALAAGGPPFDPTESALVRHEVFVTDSEAVFVFEALSGAALESLVGRLDVVSAAAAWRDLVAGSPRLATIAYTWERPGAVSGPGLGF